MITAILRDASRWQPVSPDNASNELLRLYSDKVVAGYVLSGVPRTPEDAPFDLYRDSFISLPWTFHILESVIH